MHVTNSLFGSSDVLDIVVECYHIALLTMYESLLIAIMYQKVTVGLFHGYHVISK